QIITWAPIGGGNATQRCLNPALSIDRVCDDVDASFQCCARVRQCHIQPYKLRVGAERRWAGPLGEWYGGRDHGKYWRPVLCDIDFSVRVRVVIRNDHL